MHIPPIRPIPITPLRGLALRDPLLLGITGAAGSGKTTTGLHLQARYGFEPMAFADPIKDLLAQLLADRDEDHACLHEPGGREWPLKQFPGMTARTLLQAFGDAGRGLTPSFWVRQTAHRAGLHDMPHSSPVHDRIVFTDVRYPEEAQWLRDMGGTLLRITRDDTSAAHAAAVSLGTATHSSERYWRRLPADIEIHNNGPTTEGLHIWVDAVMRQLGILERDRETA